MVMRNTEEEGPIFTKLQLIANLMLLNVLWLICSLPLVTILTSTSAMNYACIKMQRDEGEGIIKNFFHSFATNIRQGLIIGTGFIAILIILTASLLQPLSGIHSGSFASILFAILIVIILFCWFAMFTYVSMTLSRFDNTIFRTLINSMYFAIHNFFRTLKIIGVEIFGLILVPAFLWRFVPAFFVIFLMIGVPAVAYTVAKQFNNIIFAMYISPLSEQPETSR